MLLTRDGGKVHLKSLRVVGSVFVLVEVLLGWGGVGMVSGSVGEMVGGVEVDGWIGLVGEVVGLGSVVSILVWVCVGVFGIVVIGDFVDVEGGVKGWCELLGVVWDGWGELVGGWMDGRILKWWGKWVRMGSRSGVMKGEDWLIKNHMPGDYCLLSVYVVQNVPLFGFVDN